MQGKAKGDAAAATGGGRQLPLRPRELQDWLNFVIFHPLARRLAVRLAGTPVTPDMVSVAGAAMVVLAAWAYSWPAGWVAAVTGLILHLGWHVLDGADGDLARLTGRAGNRGEVIDGICDYAGHIVLYLVLGTVLHAQIGGLAWWLMLAAGLSRIIQTVHFEVQRRQYQWWVHGTPWLRISSRELVADRRPGVTAVLGTGYLHLAQWLAPNGERIDRLLGQPGDQPGSQWRALIRCEYAPVLRGLPLLGSNYRTVFLGVSMLAGTPLYFFVWEASVLSVLLLRSIGTARRATERIARQLEPSTLR